MIEPVILLYSVQCTLYRVHVVHYSTLLGSESIQGKLHQSVWDSKIAQWVNHWICEYELLTFILGPTAPRSLRLRSSVKQDGEVPE